MNGSSCWCIGVRYVRARQREPQQTVPSHHPNSRIRTGLTLLELMLALALTAVLLGLIGMAVDVHLRMLDSRQARVERSQLARAILTRIATDLRSAIQPSASASDMSSVEDLASSATSILDDSGADMADLSAAASDLGLDASGLTTDSTDIADSTTLPTSPGLYGNQYEMQVDISRIPRVDEFQQLTSPNPMGGIHDIPSDLKTVAYYVRQPGSAVTPSTQTIGSDASEGGLVRRVLDRQVTLYASESGDVNSLNQYGDVLAPEVTAMELSYFDGMQWMTEWNSEEMGGLPLAVRITLSLRPEIPASSSGLESLVSSSASTPQEIPDQIVSLVVRIPVAKPATCDDSDTVSADGLDAVGL